MPVELKKIDVQKRPLNTEDTGILVQTKPRAYVKNPAPEVLTWLKSFTDEYWKFKHPSEEEEATETEMKDEESKHKTKKTGSSIIQFALRELPVENSSLVFVATNLCDPGDFLHYIFDTMAWSKGERRTKFPMRAMPVLALTVAKPREIEAVTMPILEPLLADQKPHRFSIQFYGSMDAENMTQKEAAAILRNCIWATNPNCVQCLKYQDLAFTIDIVKPYFCLGYLLDFIKLRRYKTLSMKNGHDLSGEGEDSEDDISDDPTLDELEEKNRKVRIKRKRRAELEEIEENGESKKIQEEPAVENGEGEEEES